PSAKDVSRTGTASLTKRRPRTGAPAGRCSGSLGSTTPTKTRAALAWSRAWRLSSATTRRRRSRQAQKRACGTSTWSSVLTSIIRDPIDGGRELNPRHLPRLHLPSGDRGLLAVALHARCASVDELTHAQGGHDGEFEVIHPHPLSASMRATSRASARDCSSSLTCRCRTRSAAAIAGSTTPTSANQTKSFIMVYSDCPKRDSGR